jgi:hypothetical protein
MFEQIVCHRPPRLLEVPWNSIEQMRLVNTLCWAKRYGIGWLPPTTRGADQRRRKGSLPAVDRSMRYIEIIEIVSGYDPEQIEISWRRSGLG